VTAWGSAFVAIRAAGESLSPGGVALGRLVVSTTALSVVALARREPLPPRRDLVQIALFGVLWLGVYSVALTAAEQRVDAGTAAMLINTGPILIAVLAGAVLGEGFPPGLFAGCALALGGCVLIGLGTAHSAAGAGPGLALCVVAAVAYAVAVVVQKPVLARVSPLQVTWLGCVAATLVCLPFALALAVGSGSPRALAWTAYLGLVPTAIGFAAWSVRAAANHRRADGGACVPDPGRRGRPRLDRPRRDAAAARGGRRRAVPGWGLRRPAARQTRGLIPLRREPSASSGGRPATHAATAWRHRRTISSPTRSAASA
jgi:drug/metabolite transporter (DMT)-like permease